MGQSQSARSQRTGSAPASQAAMQDPALLPSEPPAAPTSSEFAQNEVMSPIGRFCCKFRFAQSVKNSAGRRRGFRVKMRGTSSPYVKLRGDLGKATAATRIGGCLSPPVFAKNWSSCNFRLLQQNRPVGDVGQLNLLRYDVGTSGTLVSPATMPGLGRGQGMKRRSKA